MHEMREMQEMPRYGRWIRNIRSLQKGLGCLGPGCRSSFRPFRVKGCDLAKMCLDVADKVCKGTEDCDEYFERVGSVPFI